MTTGRRTARSGLPALAACLLALGLGLCAFARPTAAQSAEKPPAETRPSAAQPAPAPPAIPGCASAARRQPPPPASFEPAREEPVATLGAGASLGVLNLPKIALGPALFAELDAGWPVDISVAYLPPNTAEVPYSKLNLELHPALNVPFPSDGSRAELSLVQLNVGTCPLRHELSNGRLLGCAGLYGGALHSTSEGLIRAGDATRFLAGAELYARWHFRLGGPIGLTYSAGVFVPFLREPFGYRDRVGKFQELFREPVIGGRLDVFLVYIID